LSNYPDYSNPWPASGTGTLTINWGSSGESCTTSEGTNTQAALEIVIITTTTRAFPKTNNLVTHYAFDPCSARSSGTGNHFSSPTIGGDTINGRTFAYKATINNIPSTSPALIARVIPLYAPTVIGVEGTTALPAQGTVVSSVGTSDNTQRKIVSFRGYPKLPPELFPFIFFSP